MQTYQNLTDHELTIPNIGVVAPHGTIQTETLIENSNLKPITSNEEPLYHPNDTVASPVQAAPEPITTEEH
jgi:hypothetical protein